MTKTDPAGRPTDGRRAAGPRRRPRCRGAWKDVSVEDVTAALTGILLATDSGQRPAQADRLLDLLVTA